MTSLFNMNFTQRFRHILEKNKLSYYKISKKTGIPQTTISSWINPNKQGKVSHPNENHLTKLATFFHTTEAWLRYGDANHVPNIHDEMMMLCRKICDLADTHPNDFSRIKRIIEIHLQAIEEEEEEEKKKNYAKKR